MEEKQKRPEEEKKAEEEMKEPPPPQEIVLKVFMHCQGCARKVRRCLKGFPGVEGVETDCKSQKVVVKGEKADPLKVVERIQSKSHSPVQLLSPLPPPPPPPPQPPAEQDPDTPQDHKEEVVKPHQDTKHKEPQVIRVVLSVHMHCEACAQGIKKRIQRMKGVESAEADLNSSKVTVKGVFEPPKLVEFIHKRTGKQAAVIKVEPEEEKPKPPQEDEKKPEDKEAKKDEEEDGKDQKKDDGGGVAAGAGGQEQPPTPPPPKEAQAEANQQQQQQQEDPKMESKKNEFYHHHPPHNYYYYQHPHYPQSVVQDYYPPQIFSDENPNACSVM